MSHTRVVRFDRGTKRREFETNYFIATEGLTELLYMEGLDQNFKLKDRKGRNLHLQLLYREGSAKNESDPKYNMNHIRDYVHVLENPREVTPSIAVNRMIQDLIDMNEPRLKSASNNELLEIHDRIIIKLLTSECTDGKYISNEDESVEIIKNELKNENIENNYLQSLSFPVFDDAYNRDIDKLCLIVDRDYGIDEHRHEARNNEYYDDLVKMCRDDPVNDSDLKKVKLYVSTPCFEFWLLLHFDEAIRDLTEDDIDSLRRNNMVPTSGKYTSGHVDGPHHRLSEHMLDIYYRNHFGTGYTKTNLDFKKIYAPLISNAIANASSFEVNLDKLRYYVGSNMGKLITEITDLR